jgi:hypothetical protein
MPITFEVDEQANFVDVKATGVVTEEDLLQYQTTLMADPRIRPGLRVLFDARTAQPGGLTPEAVRIIASLDRKLRETCPTNKSAIVVRDKQAAELAHEFETNTETNAIVFFNLDVARTWLGV